MPDRRTLTAEEFAQAARDRTIAPGGAAGVVVLRAFPAATVKAADPAAACSSSPSPTRPSIG